MWTRTLAQALMPLNVALALALLAWLLHRFGRRRLATACALIAVLGLAALSTPVVSRLLRRSLEDRHPPVAASETPAASAIVVLGGCVGPQRSPRVTIDLVDASDRVLHAARLFRAGKAPWIVACGGSRPRSRGGRSESEDMADLLVEWGVPRARILVETRSLDTRANAVEAQRILAARGLGRVLLVTSALHMPRALAAFCEAGVDAVPAPTDFTVVDDVGASWRAWLPDAAALEDSTGALHEHLGWLYYRLRGWAR